MSDAAYNTASFGTAPDVMPQVGHEHEHPHDPGVAHQFDDAVQQHEADTLGMWTFLATEVLFFGGALVAYGVYRYAYHEGFSHGSHELYEWLGFGNTCVLLCSSLTMALAVRAAHMGRRHLVNRFIAITMVFGVMFLGVKAIEYSIDWHEWLVPGLHWKHEEWAGKFGPGIDRAMELFFLFYFTLTALHALHMIIGLGLMTFILTRVNRTKDLPVTRHYNLIEVGGLYWHFVDIVWIFLFPLLYLIR
jgi:cytochrome c oxidase subunit 3